MAYTRSWLDTSPAGTANASTIDDEIRNLRKDISERMDDITAASGSGKWSDDDPIVIDSSAVGVRTGVSLFFSHDLIQHELDEDDTTWSDANWESDNTIGRAGMLGVSPVLPIGAIIQTINVLVATDVNPQVSLGLFWRTYSTSPIDTQAVKQVTGHNAAAITDLVLGTGVNHTVLTDRMYYFRFVSTSGTGRFRIYGAKMTVDLPSLNAYV